ncbi:MAG: acetyl-CoA hydrolase/transferase C-terminal domain-containing protein [Syntrophomonadaceae bacterium]|nr:acetyl-CoA hydrolase/transferase C-terminal domain-containing protein [Syntrophomonadaceae bacterium]
MSFQEEYRRKLVSADQAVRLIPNNSTVLCNVAVGHPTALVNALCRRRYEVENVEFFYVVDLYDSDIKHLEPDCGIRCDIGYPIVHRRDVQEGRFYYSPIRFFDADKVWREKRRVSTTMHLVAPMDRHGYFCMGLGADYGLAASRLADRVLVQVSSTVPRSHGENYIHISRVDAIVEEEQKLFILPEVPPNPREVLIGQYCAEMIEDESTIQLGIGGIPNAAANALEGKRDLGVHSEMACDTMRVLWEKGIITNRKKNFMPDRCIFTFAMGSQKLYDWIDDNPGIEFRAVGFVNDPYIIGLNDKLVSINAALEVDLTGQVCSESIGPRQYTHPGGQLDFVEGAWRSRGGKSIIAFESLTNTPQGPISRIVPQLKPGAVVTTCRHNVDYIVTEYGVAGIKGQSIRERARRLIAIAHPDFRDQLTFEAKKMNIL